MRSVRLLATVAVVLAAGVVFPGSPPGAAAQAASGETRRFPIEGYGALALQVPADWRASVEPPRGVMPTILTLRAPSGEELLISVFTNARREPDFAGSSRARSMAEKDGLEMLPTAVESSLELQELEGSSHIGYYYSFTDKSLVGKTPPPGEFRVLTQGHLGVGDFRLLFTILSNEKTSPVREEALRILSTATQDTPA